MEVLAITAAQTNTLLPWSLDKELTADQFCTFGLVQLRKSLVQILLP